MRKGIGTIAVMGAVAAACALALSPALSAVRSVLADNGEEQPSKVSLKMLGSIGSFTPVTRDERLARAYAAAARESLSRNFRFTPTSGSTSGEQRSLTVLVRAGPNVTPTSGPKKSGTANLGITSVDFRLNQTKGLERLAAESGRPVKDSDPIVTAELALPTTSFALPSKPKRFSTNFQLEARDQATVAPARDVPATLGSEKSYTVDLSSSYALTRNLDVEAGVRYKGPDNRLVPLTDQQQDSQAVYLGTKFKF